MNTDSWNDILQSLVYEVKVNNKDFDDLLEIVNFDEPMKYGMKCGIAYNYEIFLDFRTENSAKNQLKKMKKLVMQLSQ